MIGDFDAAFFAEVLVGGLGSGLVIVGIAMIKSEQEKAAA